MISVLLCLTCSCLLLWGARPWCCRTDSHAGWLSPPLHASAFISWPHCQKSSASTAGYSFRCFHFKKDLWSFNSLWRKQVFNDTKLCNTTAVSLQQKEKQSLQGTNEERAHCSDHSCCFQLLPSSSPVCILSLIIYSGSHFWYGICDDACKLLAIFIPQKILVCWRLLLCFPVLNMIYM